MSQGAFNQSFDLSEMFPELGLPPERNADGSPNIEFYRRQVDLVNMKMLEALAPGAKLPNGYEQMIKGIMSAAKLAGFNEEQINDRRTEADKVEAAMLNLLRVPDADFELSLDLIETIEKRFDLIDNLCAEVIKGNIEEARRRLGGAGGEGGEGQPPPDPPKLAGEALTQQEIKRVKAWRGRLRRVRRLHERAKYARTRWQANQHANHLEAAHPLRFAVWVGRSQIAEKRAAKPSSSVFLIARCHAVMAVGLWEAENGVDYGPQPKKGAIPYEGAILVAPPRHMKTEIGAHWLALRIDQNPFHTAKTGHAVDDQAQRNLAYVRSCFKPDQANGRRNLALFPETPKLSKKGNNESAMKLDLPGGAMKEPTLLAHGTGAAISGTGATIIWLDDPVDQKEADQEAERVRKFDRLNGTWLTRKTGTRAFDLTTTTLWHEDDANVRRIKLAAAGELMVRVVIQGVGGPESKPAFRPIFPELYDTDYLRAKFKAMRNPLLYACAYECNPSSKHVRRIQRLAFYDPKSAEHAEFMKSAVLHLSVDPAGSNRKTSDPAGLVYMAQGYVRTSVSSQEGSGLVTTNQRSPRLRIIEANEVPSTQYEIVKFMTEYARTISVDVFHVETHSGYTATAEMLEKFFGISQLVRHDPGNQSKLIRLQSAAGLMDAAIADNGGPIPVIEFPGVRQPDGTLGPDPLWEWLYDQLLKFGFVKRDHCVDAITQVVNHLAGELRAGQAGRITHHLQQQVDPNVDQDVQREIRELLTGVVREAAEAEDRDFEVVGVFC